MSTIETVDCMLCNGEAQLDEAMVVILTDRSMQYVCCWCWDVFAVPVLTEKAVAVLHKDAFGPEGGEYG